MINAKTFKEGILSFAEKVENTDKLMITKENIINVEKFIKTSLLENQKPKKAPNAFLIFKNSVKNTVSEDDLKGRGALARVAKQRWDSLDDSEREPYIQEYNALKERQDCLLENYYNYYGISVSEIDAFKKKTTSKKPSINPDGTKKKRGRPRKDSTTTTKNSKTKTKTKTKVEIESDDDDDEETGFVNIEYDGNEYLWDKSTNEVFDESGMGVGRKTKNGIAFC